jgi:hypothetical protein
VAAIKFSDIQQAVDSKYEPLTIELPDGTQFNMIPALRLSDAAKDELTALQDIKDRHDKAVEDAAESGDDVDDGFDICSYLCDFIAIVSDDKEAADRLFDIDQPIGIKVGRDAATLVEIVSDYTESTQPGEASPSEN